jgi:putative inorganic carbon (HCO3(-)) transporter
MSLQESVLPRIYGEVSRWRTAGLRAIAVGVIPVVLALALLKLAVADGGRDPTTLAAIQTLVFLLSALLVAMGALRRVTLIGPLAALAGALALSTLWSVRPDSSLRELLIWLFYLGAFALVSSALGSPSGARHFTDAVLVIGGWLSLIGLFLFWGADNPRLRWYSTFYAPNAFAAFLLLMLPLAAARCALARSRRQAVDYGAVTVLLGLAFVLTYSRGAYVALVLTALVAAVVLRSEGRPALSRLAIAAAATAAVVVLLTQAPGAVVSRAAAVLDSGNSSIQDRLSFWRSAVGIFRDYPALGSGPGTFAFVHGKYQGRYYAQDAHNLYVQALAEVGVVGFLAFAVMLGSLAALGVRAVRKARGREEFGLIAGCALGLLAFFLHSAVEMDWHFPANPVVAFALAGVLAWYDASGGPDAGERARTGPARPITRVAIVVLFVAVVGGVQLLRMADVEFARGRRLAAGRQWSSALNRFHGAAALNPLDPRAPSGQAVALQHLQRSDAAIPLIRRAMALDRMNAYYPLQLAETLMPDVQDDGTAGEVERLLLQGLELDPFHYPEAYRRLARLYAARGRDRDANAVYARAGRLYGSRSIAADSLLRFRLWPRVAAVYAEWAAFTASHNSTDAAVIVLDDLLRQDPGWQPAYRQIADLYVRDGRPREAAAALVAGWAERPDSLAHSPRPSRLSGFFPRAYPR